MSTEAGWRGEDRHCDRCSWSADATRAPGEYIWTHLVRLHIHRWAEHGVPLPAGPASEPEDWHEPSVAEVIAKTDAAFERAEAQVMAAWMRQSVERETAAMLKRNE